MSEVFLFGLFPYAGRRRPNLGAESQYGLSPPGFLTDFGIYFRMDSGPADLVTLWFAAYLQVHVWLLQAERLVKAEGTISVQGSSSCFPRFPQGWHGSCCGHPPVQGFHHLNSSAALLQIGTCLGEFIGKNTGSHWQKCCSKLMAQYMPLLLDVNFCRLPLAISSPQEGISSWRHSHTISISSLLPSCAFLPFFTPPSFPKPPSSVLPHPCLLLPFLFHLASFLFIFFLYLLCFQMACNKSSVLVPKTVDYSSLETKKIPPKAPKTHIRFLHISDFAILIFCMLSH